MAQDPTEGIELPLAGDVVTRCSVDGSISGQSVALILLFFGHQENFEIRISEPFLLKEGEREQSLSPESLEDLRIALGLLGKSVAEAVAYQSTGVLEVDFTDGTLLVVPPHPLYEAWELYSPTSQRGLKIVCMPGGKLAVWLPEPPYRQN